MSSQDGTKNKQDGSDSVNEATSAQRRINSAWKPVDWETVEKLRQVQEQLLRDHGGKPFENSVELIRQQREERMRELMGEDYDEQ